MRLCLGIIVTSISFLVLEVVPKRIVLDDDGSIELHSLANDTSIDPVAAASSVSVGGILAKELNKLVKEMYPEISLRRYLGKGGFGVAFDATLDMPSAQPKRCVVKFIAINSKTVGNEKKAWEKIRVATGQQKADFQRQFDDMHSECEFMRQMKQSPLGQLAVAADPSGAGAMSECILNCPGEVGDSKSPFQSSPNQVLRPCHATETQPPFIVVSYAGENGAEWVKLGSGATRSPAELYTVLNQVREGIRFMSEIHHDLKCRHPSISDPAYSPIIHHDLKWDNVCVTDLALKGQSTPDWRANLIDFGAAQRFVYFKDRVQKPVVATRGFAPPEWHVKLSYEDPPWSFDVYSLGAMTLWAVCDVSKADLALHATEMAKILRCRREQLSLACVGSGCSPKSGKAPDCSLIASTLDAALAEVNFTKPAIDFDRFKEGPSFHNSLCDRAIDQRFEAKRSICKSLWLLMHPNPSLRPKPSSFKFFQAAHRKDGLPGVVGDTWEPAIELKSCTEELPSKGDERLD